MGWHVHASMFSRMMKFAYFFAFQMTLAGARPFYTILRLRHQTEQDFGVSGTFYLKTFRRVGGIFIPPKKGCAKIRF